MTPDNTQPLITVGITCFNAEDTIARAVTSAFKQNWPNLEIVIVDDCSSDSSMTKDSISLTTSERENLAGDDKGKGASG